MKRIISSLLVFCLIITGAALFAAPTYAMDEPPPRTQAVLRLNHADIEQQVRRNNPMIRNNAITEQGLTDFVGTPMMTDAMIAGQGALLAMQMQTQTILAQIMATPPPEEPDPIRDGIIFALMNDIASIERDIMQMNAQMEQMQSDPVRNTVSRGVQQLNNANRQIIWGVESMYLGYHTLSRQIEQTRETLDALNRSISVMERRYAVGHITARALQNVRGNRTQLKAGIVNMENELENLKGQINIMLGRNYDAPLQLGALPEADRDFLSTRNRETDLRSARSNNHTINIARIDIDENAALSGENARRQEAIAQNTYDNELRGLSQRKESLIRAINDRLAALELAEDQLWLLEQTLEETQRRFDRGIIARADLEAARSEVRLQEIRIDSADAELFSAIRRYEWFVRGLNT